MQNSFFQAICRVGIFMICAQAMIHFRPQEVYEKYLKLLVSIMVLIQLFLPLGSFLIGGGGQEAADLLEQFKRELEEGMETARENAAAADALLEQMSLEELRKQLERQQVSGSEDEIGNGEAEERSSAVPGRSDGAQEKKESDEVWENRENSETQTRGENNKKPENEEKDGRPDGIRVEVTPVEPVRVGGEE